MRSALAAGLLLAFVSSAAPAQEDPAGAKKARQQAAYKARYEEFLKAPWIAEGGWITDYDGALAAAAAGKKLIVGVFTRSYKACPYTEQLVSGVLTREEFRAFAKDHVPFLHVTTMIEGEKNGNLMEEKRGDGFPHVVAMDAEGTVLSVLEERTMDGFRAMVKEAVEYRDLKAKKDPSSPEQLKLLGMDLERGLIKPAEYREKAGALGDLDEKAEKDREAVILHLDIYAQLERFKGLKGPDPALRVEVGRIFAAMVSDGRVPAAKRDLGPFCEIMLDFAESSRDADLFAFAFGKMKDLYGDQKRLDMYWPQLQKRLDAIRADTAGKKDGKPEEKKPEEKKPEEKKEEPPK